MIGIDPESKGLAQARAMGLHTTPEGLKGALPYLQRDGVKIAFDATSAKAHVLHAEKLRELGIKMIDMTPAAVGPFCVPPVNLKEHHGKGVENVNMVSCGGQATIPMVAAVSQVQDVEYAEIIATVASKSIGPGTRQNIDEFTRTTSKGIEMVGGARKGKAIIIVNPAEPPILMRDTIHCLTTEKPDQEQITESIHKMVERVSHYVPGYRLTTEPVFEDRRISVFLEVKGLGDFLPEYAGNLDIMTAAALQTSELMVQEMHSLNPSS